MGTLNFTIVNKTRHRLILILKEMESNSVKLNIHANKMITREMLTIRRNPDYQYGGLISKIVGLIIKRKFSRAAIMLHRLDTCLLAIQKPGNNSSDLKSSQYRSNHTETITEKHKVKSRTNVNEKNFNDKDNTGYSPVKEKVLPVLKNHLSSIRKKAKKGHKIQFVHSPLNNKRKKVHNRKNIPDSTNKEGKIIKDQSHKINKNLLKNGNNSLQLSTASPKNEVIINTAGTKKSSPKNEVIINTAGTKKSLPENEVIINTAGTKKSLLKNEVIENTAGTKKSLPENEVIINTAGTKKSYTEWGEWSACSSTCGVGKSERRRHCIDKEKCHSYYHIKTRPCLLKPCQIT